MSKTKFIGEVEARWLNDGRVPKWDDNGEDLPPDDDRDEDFK